MTKGIRRQIAAILSLLVLSPLLSTALVSALFAMATVSWIVCKTARTTGTIAQLAARRGHETSSAAKSTFALTPNNPTTPKT
jgi:hypothetical protein